MSSTRLTRVGEYQGRVFNGSGEALASQLESPRFGYLSAKDGRLLQDALMLECDAFLTMNKRLAKNVAHLEAALQIKVLRPSGRWALLEPWAALYV
jgi:hypothetical protein